MIKLYGEMYNMHALIDADSAIFKAGCANEVREYLVQAKDHDGVESFKYKKDLDAYIDGDETLEWEKTKTAGPLRDSLSNLKHIINKIANNPRFSSYEVFIAGEGNFRKELVDYYKKDRDPFSIPLHYDQLHAYLRRKYNAVVVNGEEVDDRVSILCYQNPLTHVICSIDKDLDNTPGFHYNPDKDEFYYVDPQTADYLFYRQMLTGDGVDSIPGLPGIGIKKAEPILADAESLEDMCKTVYDAYVAKGYDYDYFVEQGRLLWMRREEGEMWVPPLSLRQSLELRQPRHEA
jgi:hypothetical protein